MFSIYLMMLAVVTVDVIKGVNIMLNKPSIQSSTLNLKSSDLANDGIYTGQKSYTLNEDYPYWQGDLLGYYMVTSVTVTSHDGSSGGDRLRDAIIGVSVNNVSCPEGDFVQCGQWPSVTMLGHNITFNCSMTAPVRFVRIRRQTANCRLALAEVEVDGTPSSLPGTHYERESGKKVITATQSLTVATAPNCSVMCHRTQPCLAFSYSPSQLSLGKGRNHGDRH